MPTYLCSGSVCRMRTVRSFFICRHTVMQTISLAKLIAAKNESEAKGMFWNDHFHPRIMGKRWSAQHIEILEISSESVLKILTEGQPQLV